MGEKPPETYVPSLVFFSVLLHNCWLPMELAKGLISRMLIKDGLLIPTVGGFGKPLCYESKIEELCIQPFFWSNVFVVELCDTW